jgi:tetraacyldisaccharide 4'-kinase
MKDVLLSGISFVYAQLAKVKNIFYDRDWLGSLRVPQKVISVGNLTVGGTGKTPIVDLVLTHFEERSLVCGLISRNYKARIRHTAAVDLLKVDGASYYGDEAWMLALKHVQATVFVGPKKWYSLSLASKATRAQVFVIDDGFQHRALARDLDIVLLDATAPMKDYHLLPLGRAREAWQGLRRAQIVVITKTNLAEPAANEALRSRLQSEASFSGLVVETQVHIDLERFRGKKVLAFAGLARPEQFEKVIKMTEAVELKEFVSFSDHHIYSKEDIALLKNKSQGLDFILTTEKDFVKLNPKDFLVPLHAVPLVTRISHHATEFYAALDSLIL